MTTHNNNSGTVGQRLLEAARQRESPGDDLDALGARFGVSGRLVREGISLLRCDADQSILNAVKDGHISVYTAVHIAKNVGRAEQSAAVDMLRANNGMRARPANAILRVKQLEKPERKSPTAPVAKQMEQGLESLLTYTTLIQERLMQPDVRGHAEMHTWMTKLRNVRRIMTQIINQQAYLEGGE